MFLRNKMDENILRGIAKRFLASTTPGQVSAIREELLDLIELVQ